MPETIPHVLIQTTKFETADYLLNTLFKRHLTNL